MTAAFTAGRFFVGGSCAKSLDARPQRCQNINIGSGRTPAQTSERGTAMKEYELIIEQFGTCDGRPKSTVKEIQIEDPDAYMQQYLTPKATCEKSELESGGVEYAVIDKDYQTKYIFTPI